MATPQTYYTRGFLGEETIAQIALKWRQAGGVNHLNRFDVTDFAANALRRHFKEGKRGKLEIITDRSLTSGRLAFVKVTDRVTLTVDRDVWSDAALGEEESRYVIAHEIGHVLLHSNEELFYSPPLPENAKRVFEPGHSTEDQANLFADYFLLPHHIVIQHPSPELASSRCDVTLALVERQLRKASSGKYGQLHRHSEPCPLCMRFSLTAKGVHLVCDQCGPITP